MKQNNLNIISTTMLVLFLTVMSAQAAGAVTVGGLVFFPSDIAVDSAGNIYVADTGFNNIDIFNATFSATGAHQLVGVGLIEFPSGVAVGAGRIYVADDNNNSIKVFDSTTGDLVNTVGLGVLNSPEGVTVDDAGNIHVADSGNNRIQTFNIDGSQQTIGGGQLNFPSGIDEDGAGNIYVADSGNNRLLKFNATGDLLQTIPGLNFPNDVDVDSSGNIYVADTGNDSIKVFNPDGSLKQAIGTRGAADGQFDLPMGVAVDSAGNIYVADGNNNRIQLIPVQPVVVNGAVSGTVTNATSTAPEAGVSVSAGGVSVLTDTAGLYSMSLAVGTYTVTATKAGFRTNTTSGVVVNAGATTTLDIALQTKVKGELNDIPGVDVGDVLFCAQYVVGVRTYTPEQEALGDVNAIPGMDVGDVLYIAQAVAGLRTL